MDWSCVCRALRWLEPYAVKVARTVPRGEGGRKAILLPDYMSQHYGLDQLAAYGTEPIPDTTNVVNPAWRRADAAVRRERALLSRAQAEFGASQLAANPEAEVAEEFERQKGEQLERLHRMASRAHDVALQHLCDELTDTETPFPGTDLRLIFQPVGATSVPRSQES